MKLYRFLILVSVLFIFKTLIYGQGIDLNTAIATDPNVRIGKLDNGLTYYIRNNHKPEKRVYLWMAVKAGSCYESEAQRGLAHFTEHMAFNGTLHFKSNDLIDYLEKNGMKFGADLNAHTAFNETVYKLEIPTDNNDVINKGFLILEDWAHNLSFDDKEIDKERGVIMEEWRLGLGADDRMRKKYLPVILKGSKYADRLPIGLTDVIQHCNHDTLRKFYHDWYRPDLISVVIVGDIDPALAEREIKEHFSNIKDPVNERKAVDYQIPDNKDPLISICTDKEATNSSIEILFKHKKQVEKTLKDYEKYLTINLYTDMLNKRFEELSQKADASFIYAYSGYGEFLAKTLDAFSLGAAAKENKIDQTIETLITENERVRRFGFTQTELDRVKADILIGYERAAKEADKTESMNFVHEYVDNFLNSEPIPGIKNELEYVKELLPMIKLEDVNKLSKELITDDNMCMIVTAPEKAGLKVPTEAEILKDINEGKTANITAYIDKVSDSPLITEQPKGSKIVSTKENQEFGYTELTFGNGVKVVLKPTDFKNDEILFSAYGLGGTSLYPDKDILSATFASTIMDEGGLGKFDKTELEKKLSGKIVQVSPWMDDLREGFHGSCSPQDIETLLQLTYLYCTDPRKDTSEFNGFMSKMRNQLKFLSSSPRIVFADTLQKTITSNNPRTIGVPTVKQLDKINLDLAYNIFKERFGDDGSFTFFLVGNFKIDEIKPMLERYLGGLPSTHKKEMWKNVEPKFPAGVTEVTVHKGTEPKSTVAIIMKDKFDWNYKNLIDYQMLMEILQIKLRQVMREDKSEIYGLQASGNDELYPTPTYTISFAFGCAPKNVNGLVKTMFKEIKKIQKHGPSQTDLDKVKENLNHDRETNIKKNNFWQSKLEYLYYMDIKLNTLDEYKNIVNSVTLDDIKKEANTLITKDHYVKVVLMPEEKKK